MCTQSILSDITKISSDELEKIFGNKLKKVILYGSYARGDYDEESDIDIAVIVDEKRIRLSEYHKRIVAFSTGIDLKYNVVSNFSIIPYDEFNAYKDILPYYKNIQMEGVDLIA